MWDTLTNAWVNDYKYTVNMTNQRLNNYVGQEWDNISNSWVNAEKYDATYNSAGQMLTEEWAEWFGSAWDPTERLTYTYDSNGNLLTMTEQEWSNAWVNLYKETHTYDSNGNQTSSTSQIWGGSSWTNSNNTERFFDCVTASVVEVSSKAAGSVFPNPASDVISIRTDIQYSAIILRDITGKEVMSIDTGSEINVRTLDKGIYLISLADDSGGTLRTMRFIKE
jgi:hypothetical protein